jgi:NO-binding membrane sensor protein with MHYT domain
MHGTYDFRSVALSVTLAIFASYAALDLTGRITASHRKARLFWLFGGAAARAGDLVDALPRCARVQDGDEGLL